MFSNELNISNKGFDLDFKNILSKKEFVDNKIITSVSKIIQDISSRGDDAVIQITKKLDNHLIEGFFVSIIISGSRGFR